LVSVLAQTNTPAVALFTAVPESGAGGMNQRRKYTDERSPVLAMQTAFPRLTARFVEPAATPDMEFAPERIFEEAAVPLFNIVASGWWETTFGPMSEDGATSCFAGHMGNTTLTWDGQISVASLFLEGRFLRMASEAAALAGYRPLRTARSMLSAALGPYVPPAFRDSRWRKDVALHSGAEARLKMMDRLRASGDMRCAVPRNGTEQRVAGLTGRRALVAETLAWARARHGIETRDPLDDTRLIDFCMSIPEDQFLRRGQTRWLARRLLRAAGVPAAITDNTRRGAWHPEPLSRIEKRRESLHLEVARLRESATAARLLDLDRLTQLVAGWPQTAADSRPGLPGFYVMLTRALHVGAFIRWAEAQSAHAVARPVRS
jgi:asparagine synthase (glutamine-hydrolysing)